MKCLTCKNEEHTGFSKNEAGKYCGSYESIQLCQRDSYHLGDSNAPEANVEEKWQPTDIETSEHLQPLMDVEAVLRGGDSRSRKERNGVYCSGQCAL